MDITLVGGGWNVEAQTACLQPFLQAAAARAGDRPPRVAFLWVDEGDGTHWGRRWSDLVTTIGQVDAHEVSIPLGKSLDTSTIVDVDGLFVCGGLTPAYAESLLPAAGEVRRLVLEAGLPYAGSSAGAAVAARTAVVGGYLSRGRVVCPADAAEDLDEVAVVAGLGLVAEMVDVHASTWGTLPRLAAALADAPTVPAGVGLDEDTAWHVTDTGSEILGANAVHRIERDGGSYRWSVIVPATGR